MYLTKHQTPRGPRFAMDGRFLPGSFRLGQLLELPATGARELLKGLTTSQAASGALLAPLDDEHEVWASGVTYWRSRQARESETTVKDIYDRVYEAERPELFFKSLGFRVRGHEQPIRVRRDGRWNVPEPELTLVINAHREIVGYTAGNDVSSRDIEGENPLYLPQAKVYDGSCALGPGIVLCGADVLRDLPIRLSVLRDGQPVFEGQARVSQMKRELEELVGFLLLELAFPRGVLLLTGTGIVPGDDFTLLNADRVRIQVGDLTLENPVECSRH